MCAVPRHHYVRTYVRRYGIPVEVIIETKPPSSDLLRWRTPKCNKPCLILELGWTLAYTSVPSEYMVMWPRFLGEDKAKQETLKLTPQPGCEEDGHLCSGHAVAGCGDRLLTIARSGTRPGGVLSLYQSSSGLRRAGREGRVLVGPRAGCAASASVTSTLQS